LLLAAAVVWFVEWLRISAFCFLNFCFVFMPPWIGHKAAD